MNTDPQCHGVLKHLPPTLQYLVAPALRFGCRTELDAFSRLDNATSHDVEYLGTIADRVLQNGHFPEVMRFLDEYQMTEYDECAQLYFFFGLLDHGGFKFD